MGKEQAEDGHATLHGYPHMYELYINILTTLNSAFFIPQRKSVIIQQKCQNKIGLKFQELNLNLTIINNVITWLQWPLVNLT